MNKCFSFTVENWTSRNEFGNSWYSLWTAAQTSETYIIYTSLPLPIQNAVWLMWRYIITLSQYVAWMYECNMEGVFGILEHDVRFPD